MIDVDGDCRNDLILSSVDESGNQFPVEICNLGSLPTQFIHQTFEKDTWLIIKDPFIIEFAKGINGIRVDNPEDCKYFHKNGYLVTFMHTKEDFDNNLEYLSPRSEM